MPAAGDELLSVAGRLVANAGRAELVRLEQLAGGRNNRVFRLELADGERLILKSYFADPRDPRDRLGTEWRFLTYVFARGVRVVPEPVAADQEHHLGLYGFIPGRKLTVRELAATHVDAAADFLLAVNAPSREPGAFPPGSEACFTLAQHLATVERRLARLETLDPEAPLRDTAMRFILMRLAPAWHTIRARIEHEAEAIGLALDATLDLSETCVSPSDFGFHNALVTADHVAFIDFEYAGRDDPAKLVSDFFCQPEVPVPIRFYDRFLERVASGLDLSERDRTRCRILLDAYRIKWMCIILNDFLPLGAARRAFADPTLRAERCAAQLAKAEERLSEIV